MIDSNFLGGVPGILMGSNLLMGLVVRMRQRAC